MILAAPLLALLAAAPLAPGETFALDPAHSAVRFHVTHKLHEVDGRATEMEGKAVVAADGRILAMVRVPVARLDTAEGNRDANLRAVMESGKYPFVVFKGVGAPLKPAAAGKPISLELAGELELHGVKHPMTVPVELELAPDGSAHVRGTFHVSLDAYGVERPALLFVKIDDDCRVDLDLVLPEVKG